MIESYKEQGSHIVTESHNPVSLGFREMDTLADIQRIFPGVLAFLSPAVPLLFNSIFRKSWLIDC